jgi:GNAT superfamily N-acetyltransferase
MPSPEIHYRPYQPEDEAAVAALYQRAFGKALHRERWRWRFPTTPVGLSYLLVAVSEGACVGYLGYCPLPLQDGGEAAHGVEALIALDGMVDPACHGRGIFQQLVRRLSARLPEDVPYIGFPNHRSFGIFIHKLGWVSPGPLQVRLKPLGMGKAGGLARRSRLLGFLALLARPGIAAYRGFYRWRGQRSPGVEVVPLEDFRTVEPAWQRARGRLGITFRRDPAALAWRFEAAPDDYLKLAVRVAGEVVGMVIFKVETRFGFTVAWVMDAFVDTDDPQEEGAWLTAALLRAEAFLPPTVDFASLLLPHRRYARAVARAGYRWLPPKLLPHAFFFIVRRNGYPETVEKIDNWYLSWSLHDVL